MAAYDDRERFIPVSKQELVDMLKEEDCASDEDKEKFSAFCKMIESLFHFEFHDNLEELKRTYAPFDPDRDTVAEYDLTPEQEKEALVRLAEGFGDACENANYVRMSDEELNEAFEGWSPFGGINLKLDLNHYVEYALYYRGMTMETRLFRKLTDLLKFDFKKKPFQSKVYKRLAILAKVKDVGRASKKFDTDHVFVKLFKNVPALDLEMLFPTTKPALKKLDFFQIWLPVMLGILMTAFNTINGYFAGVTLDKPATLGTEVHFQHEEEGDPVEPLQLTEENLKSIRDGSLVVQAKPVDGSGGWESLDEAATIKALTIARNTVSEEVFKAIRVDQQGNFVDKVDEGNKIRILVKNDLLKSFAYGVLAGGAVAFLALLASWTMKSVFKYLQSKQKYQGVLAQNLFYLNLDNNSGVFNALIDAAEEEECKEAFFAAFFLNSYPNGNPDTGKPWTSEELDDYIEQWIEGKMTHKVIDPDTGEEKVEPCRVDFEIEDALQKLERLGLLEQDAETGQLKMLSWDKALERVDYIWDNFFEYNNAGGGEASA